jgi:hypothetical protein
MCQPVRRRRAGWRLLGYSIGILCEAAAPSAAELTITEPVNLAVLKISEPIPVMDIGGGPPEGNVHRPGRGCGRNGAGRRVHRAIPTRMET